MPEIVFDLKRKKKKKKKTSINVVPPSSIFESEFGDRPARASSLILLLDTVIDFACRNKYRNERPRKRGRGEKKKKKERTERRFVT